MKVGGFGTFTKVWQVPGDAAKLAVSIVFLKKSTENVALMIYTTDFHRNAVDNEIIDVIIG